MGFETTKDKARAFNLWPLMFDQKIGAVPETQIPARCCICHYPTELWVSWGLGSQGVQKEMVEEKVSVGGVVADDECAILQIYRLALWDGGRTGPECGIYTNSLGVNTSGFSNLCVSGTNYLAEWI